jgi:hypothetical protein
MTWEPTNELRYVQRHAMKRYAWGYEHGRTAGYTWGPYVEGVKLILQQKWRWAHGTDVHMEPKFEWRDVPTEVDE